MNRVVLWVSSSMSRALEELQFFCDHFEVLGVYPADPFRWRA